MPQATQKLPLYPGTTKSKIDAVVQASTPIQDRFVVEFARGQLLQDYDSEVGAILTDSLSQTKLFVSERSAQEVAWLLGGRVQRVVIGGSRACLRIALLHERGAW